MKTVIHVTVFRTEVVDPVVRRYSVSRAPRLLSLMAATALPFLAFPATAAEFVVNTPQDLVNGACTASQCSLRDAILAANATTGPNTIHLDAHNYGVFIQGNGKNVGLTGDFDVMGDLTIIGAGRDATKLFISSPSEQIIDVATGARLRLEHLSIGIGIRPGYFGDDDAATTRLELLDVAAGGNSPSGNTIVANGNPLIDHSSIQAGGYSNGQTAIIFDGENLDIANSTVDWAKVGLRITLSGAGGATFTNSCLTRSDNYRSDPCGTLSITGTATQNVCVIASQITNRAAIGAGSCITGIRNVSIVDSAITVDGNNYNKAMNIEAHSTSIRNSTIVCRLGIGYGTKYVNQSTVGSNFYAFDVPPVSIGRSADSIVVVSNSVLIGECHGAVASFGNNVESPGNSCGLRPESSRINQSLASLGLGPLASNTPPGAPTAPVNYLPAPTSVLNRVFTPEGVARCPATDQRGYVRAAVCTIGAVETDANEQVLFLNGFDY